MGGDKRSTGIGQREQPAVKPELSSSRRSPPAYAKNLIYSSPVVHERFVKNLQPPRFVHPEAPSGAEGVNAAAGEPIERFQAQEVQAGSKRKSHVGARPDLVTSVGGGPPF